MGLFNFSKKEPQNNLLKNKNVGDIRSFEELMQCAENNNLDAQMTLGVLYATGANGNIPIDNKKANYWLTKSAEGGNSQAQFNLGVSYRDGNGVQKNFEKAIFWFTKSAENGNTDGQFAIGAMHANGEGCHQDYSKAFHWHMMAAEKGFTHAQLSIGTCYFLGRGVERNLEKAKFWTEKAARQGNRDAIIVLNTIEHDLYVESAKKNNNKIYFYYKELSEVEKLVRIIGDQIIGWSDFHMKINNYLDKIEKGLMKEEIEEWIGLLKDNPLNKVFSAVGGWSDEDMKQAYGRKRVNPMQELWELLEAKL